MFASGFDCGTYNLITCNRNENEDFVYKREINAFFEIPLENRFVFDMMNNAGVPLIERDNVAYALGEAAVKMAYTMNQSKLRRPMKDGCVNPKEIDAFNILNVMMHSLIGEIKGDTIVYYSVPANAINEETDADYHSKILEAVFKAYSSSMGYNLKAFPINEGQALVYAELSNKQWTGIGISFGAGMVNLSYSIFGAPVFSFALVNSGDWIDRQAARASGQNETYINQKKMDVDLSKEPKDLVERAIHTQYRIMIEKTVTGIKQGLERLGNKGNADADVDVVISGGTSSPNGFDQLFKTVLKEGKLPIKTGEVIRPDDPLYSVARGCLLAAESSMRG